MQINTNSSRKYTKKSQNVSKRRVHRGVRNGLASHYSIKPEVVTAPTVRSQHYCHHQRSNAFPISFQKGRGRQKNNAEDLKQRRSKATAWIITEDVDKRHEMALLCHGLWLTQERKLRKAASVELEIGVSADDN